jgi:hypothetical protein
MPSDKVSPWSSTPGHASIRLSSAWITWPPVIIPVQGLEAAAEVSGSAEKAAVERYEAEIVAAKV